MKILFICENYIPHYGGAEIVSKNLAENYVKLGHQVTLLTRRLKGTKKREIINGVVVQRISSFNSRYIFTFSAILRAIRLARKHDIVQTTTFNGAPPAWLASRLTRTPIIITVHEVWVGKWKEITGFSWLKRNLHDSLEKLIYFLPYDRYICVSNSTKKDLLTLGIKPKKVETVYNGLDYEFWDPIDIDRTKYLELKKNLELDGKFVYFSWGRPGESKGFEYAIQAIPIISQQVPNAILALMFGSTEQYQKKYTELMELINKLNLQDKIKIIDSVPHQELRYYLKAFDCAIIPSVAEGFGYNAVEAITMGIPVVVSNAGSLPEVVSGKYLLFESKNVQDLAKKAIRIAQGDYPIRKIKKYLWEPSIKRYLEIYQEMANMKPFS